jgi:hypothetical protein
MTKTMFQGTHPILVIVFMGGPQSVHRILPLGRKQWTLSN